jgi:hypothetical protein
MKAAWRTFVDVLPTAVLAAMVGYAVWMVAIVVNR